LELRSSTWKLKKRRKKANRPFRAARRLERLGH
jgi:hypothetical protein